MVFWAFFHINEVVSSSVSVAVLLFPVHIVRCPFGLGAGFLEDKRKTIHYSRLGLDGLMFGFSCFLSY